MGVELVPAGPEDREVLYRLLQYSLYEESVYDGNEMGEDGLFAYPWFDAYFLEEGREAYLIRKSGKLAGFALIRRTASGHSMAEFLVLPPYRRRGVGRAAALACFRRYPGAWEVAPSQGSEAAFRFWQRVIAGYTGKEPRFEAGAFVFSHAGATVS